MDKFIEYAPIIVVVVGFLISYKIFITPAQLDARIKELETELDNKFVHKEAHDIIIAEMKDDISEIKAKIDIIYNKIMGVS